MTEADREPGGGRLRWLLAAGLLTFLLVGYVGAMRATVDVSEVASESDAARRDQVYLVVHGGLLFLAVVAGFAAGKWVNGLGVGFALLFLVVMAIAMVSIQVVSFEIACSGGPNGLIRHWHC